MSRHERGGTLTCALVQERFDVLVLNWTLPDVSGLDVIKHERDTLGSPVPILLVSGTVKPTL